MVAGGGCAAFASAIILARAGLNVVVVAPHDYRVGKVELPETLAPTAVKLLESLGVPLDELQLQLTPIAGRLSRWGQGAARFVPAMAELHGLGFLLGKQRLVRMLSLRAATAGAFMIAGEIDAVVAERQSIQLRISEGSGHTRYIQAQFVIDATGRISKVARCLGVRRHVLNRLVSFWLVITERPCEPVIAVQTVTDGWLFLAPHLYGGMALGFFTEGSSVTGVPSPHAIAARLVKAPELASLAGDPEEWAAVSLAITRNAATTILDSACGERWIACGDALRP